MLAVWKKELRQYRTSVIGAVFLAAYAGLIGYYFVIGNLLAMNGDITALFQSIYSTLMILIPVLTMRLFAEEKRMGTDQLLFTSPVDKGRIILGKFFAALVIFCVGSLPIVLDAAVLAYYGCFRLMETIGCFLGLFLGGSGLLAIGVFASSLTENQVVAAIVSYLIMIFLWLLDYLKYYVPGDRAARLLEYLSFQFHFTELSSGIFSASAFVYFTSLTGLMLGLTGLVLESRRWK